MIISFPYIYRCVSTTHSDGTRNDTIGYILIHFDASGSIKTRRVKKRLREISDDAFQRVLMQHGRRKCQELSLVKVSLGFARSAAPANSAELSVPLIASAALPA